MAVIKFTAVNRGELPSWLSAGATFYLANNFQQYPRGLVAKGEVEETLDGTPEGYLHALQREFSIVTDFIPLYERPLWRAFFTSVLNAETFQIDLTARQLLGNPSFEAGNTSGGWTVEFGGNSFTVTSAISAVGVYTGWVGLSVNPDGKVISNPPFAGPHIAVSPGQTALAQGIAKPDAGASVPNRNLSLAAIFRDSGGTAVSAGSVATALAGTNAYQLLSGTAVAPANSARVQATYSKAAPNNTDETGKWLVDETLLAILSSWLNVWLVDRRIEEQQIGGVGVRYRFKVKTVP